MGNIRTDRVRERGKTLEIEGCEECEAVFMLCPSCGESASIEFLSGMFHLAICLHCFAQCDEPCPKRAIVK